MDSFETLIATIFQKRGYWTWQGFRVELTAEDKRNIGTPSMPRTEIDILAYKPGGNELLWIECKSYLDSYGVRASSFEATGDRDSMRYKVFTQANYRDVITRRLIAQVVDEGLTLDNPKVGYVLVAGKIYPKRAADLKKHFDDQHVSNWKLYGPDWIIDQLKQLSQQQYENNLAMMVAKLIYRSENGG